MPPTAQASSTVTVEQTEVRVQERPPQEVLVLRLEGRSAAAASRRVQFNEDVVDNEHLGRKKSKSELLESREFRGARTKMLRLALCLPACDRSTWPAVGKATLSVS
jgi:hypothetical protein